MNIKVTIRMRQLRIAAIGGLSLLGFLAGLAWLPRTYQSQASVVLTAHRQVATRDQGDVPPGHAPSPALAAHVLRQMIAAPATVSSIAEQGYQDPYAVTISTSAAIGPVLTITVTGRDRAMVQETLRAVLARLSSDITRLRGRTPGLQLIRAIPMSATSPADLAVSQTVRPYLIVTVLGLVIVLGVPVAADRLSARRRASRQTVRGWVREPVPDVISMAKD